MAEASNPLEGFQQGSGWLQDLPNMMTSITSGIDPASGFGLFVFQYGTFMILGCAAALGGFGYALWLAHKALRAEI